jgi:hypothetical protein
VFQALKSLMKTHKKLSRKQAVALLAAALTNPLKNSANNGAHTDQRSGTAEYESVLLPDGTVAKAPKQLIDNSKVVHQQVSNKTLLKWLEKSRLKSK